MKRELLILRHAKSSWADGSLSDFDRPLKGRGKNDAPKVGRFLIKQGLLPDLILCSSARRAIQTVQGLINQLSADRRPTVSYRESLYLADHESLLAILREVTPATSRLMLVGHNPGLEDLLQFLLEKPIAPPADGKLLPTATLAHLDILPDWNDLDKKTARLRSITRPKAMENEPA